MVGCLGGKVTSAGLGPYVGDAVNGVPEGTGTYTYDNGDVCWGEGGGLFFLKANAAGRLRKPCGSGLQ